MNIVRYQNSRPSAVLWPTLDRWSGVRDEINTLLELPFWAQHEQPPRAFNDWNPALDLYQDPNNVVAVLELPGMRKEDIEITLHEGVLTIAGERREAFAEGEKVTRTERFVGRFCRSIPLPARVNAAQVTATYREGLLTVTLPKAEEAKTKQIQVNAD